MYGFIYLKSERLKWYEIKWILVWFFLFVNMWHKLWPIQNTRPVILELPGGISQGIPQQFFFRATPPLSLLKHFWLFQSTMNFNFVETHVFTKLDISLDIYFSFARLVELLGPEISVWKFWPKIPLTLYTKLWGPVAPSKFF